MSNEERKIFAGTLFSPADPELRALKLRAHNANLIYNGLPEDATEAREACLRGMLGRIGRDGFIQGPLWIHYGTHVQIGDSFFANFNLTIQDDAPVTIGSNCRFGPNVTIVTPLHPLLPDERNAIVDETGVSKALCYAKPVSIGDDCWLGANVVVCPGVTIGPGCVIGAGSVVIRDIPPYSLAVGNPCRVMRRLGAQDSMAYHPELLGNCSVPTPYFSKRQEEFL